MLTIIAFISSLSVAPEPPTVITLSETVIVSTPPTCETRELVQGSGTVRVCEGGAK